MADIEHSSITKADSHPPADHASEHTDGTDDIQSATSGQKGLATAAQITKLDGIASGATTDANLTAHLNDASDAHDASAISFAPAGTIAATTVQTAIEEAASEGGGGGASIAVEEDGSEEGTGIDRFDFTTGLNLSVSGSQATVSADQTDLNNHLSDASDAHDASAISVLDSANQYTATNAEDALAEVLDGLQAHEADSSDAHDASAISFAPAGTIAATTVQAAIEEVASEGGGGGGGHRTLVTLGSDVTNSTSTLADVTGLSFAVTAGTIYRFFAMIYYTAGATGTGARFTVNGPASPTLLAYRSFMAVANSGFQITAALYDSGSATTTSNSPSGNIATVEGIIQPSTSGTLVIRFASEAPGTGNDIVAKAGSTLEYW